MIYIRSCLLGILISLSTSYIILTLSLLSDNADISSKELMQQLVIALAMGIVIGLATTIYFLDKFSLTIATIIHFSIVTVVVLVAGTVGQWFDWNQPSSIIGVFIIRSHRIYHHLDCYSYFNETRSGTIKSINPRKKVER